MVLTGTLVTMQTDMSVSAKDGNHQRGRTVEVKIDIDPEEYDKIISKSLREHLELNKAFLKNRKDDTGMAIFDTDKDKDIEKIKEHIKAFKLLISYYG
jgi:hypothetical protein